MSYRADRIRALANWINLSTPLGLAIAGFGRAQLRRGPRGLWLGENYGLRFPRAGAFTVGSVVLVRGHRLEEIEREFPDLIEHEEKHARQWAWCLGLPFLPLYLAATVWSRWRTGTNHGANLFEIRADLAKGGYRPVPRRRVNAN